MICLLALVLILALPAASQERAVPPIVDAQWLALRLNDPDLVVLHVAYSRKDYSPEHIPGARFLWVYDLLAPLDPDRSTEMPSADQAEAVFHTLGISDHSRIVLYVAGAGVPAATRMFLTFDYFGLGERTGILDGGLQAWKDAGGAVTTELPTDKSGSYKPQPGKAILVNADWIRDRLSDDAIALIDTRGKSSFEGRSGGVPRHGHIPGASNIPTTAGIDSANRFVHEEEFSRLLQSAGITKQQRVVPYCQVGQSASVIYFLARAYGWTTGFYDGSFEDWSSRGEEYPVEQR